MGNRLNRFDDQITFPLSFPLGMVVRVLSRTRQISLAMVVRNLLVAGISLDPQAKRLYEVYSKMPTEQLLNERKQVEADPGWQPPE